MPFEKNVQSHPPEISFRMEMRLFLSTSRGLQPETGCRRGCYLFEAGPRISGTAPLTVPVAGSLPASSPILWGGPFGEVEAVVPLVVPPEASPVLGPVMSGTALRMVSLAGSFPSSPIVLGGPLVVALSSAIA
jgi:hypothetical protein